MASARSTVVLADYSKWGVVGIASIAQLEEADELITDSNLGEDARRVLAENVAKLRIADVQAK